MTIKHWSKLVALLAAFALLAAAGEPAAGAEMSLREAVEYALSHSPDLKSSQTEVQRRQGLVTTARSFLMPQVDLSADAARSRYEHGYPAGTTPSLLRFDTAQYTGVADLKFLTWDFRKTELELAATRERVEAARSTTNRRRQEITFETARLYLQTLAYSDLINSAEARTKSLQSLLDRTNLLVQGGRAVPVDALKIKTRLAQVDSDLATLRSGRRSSLSALASVMGFEGDLPRLVYTAASSTPPIPPEPEVQLLNQADASRPELVSQDHEIRASERLEESARKAVFPRIDIRASAIQYGSNTPVGFPQLIGKLLPSLSINVPSPGNAATDWVIGVHVSFPLFDGGRRKGQIQAAQAQLEQSRLARQQLQFRITREVRTALADLESAQGRVTALRDSVAESERVLHDERLKFEAGRSVINFVLDAESALLTSQSLLSQAERSVSTAALALDLSTGQIEITRLPNP
ncbi:MAG TPA: TolC family protein [Edaphobacter sp.]|nr:TolC family protein [Edaphobacter sp.]